MNKYTVFYQLREGDHFEIEGISYMKVWRSKDRFGNPYNAKTSAGVKRFVLDEQQVTPADEFYTERISPITSDVHEL